ncbi:hypothetical protein F5Y14DRAFT_465537 [Nemania sp. NC0429]|nr:hypothetical protein F5Y14DRAFT_465537 [Nemania sp. NC0429]
MTSQNRKTTFQESPIGQAFTRRPSMPPNSSTGNFTSRPADVQRAPPTQPRSFQPRLWTPGQQDHGYTSGIGGQGRGGSRGRGRAQGQQATSPPQLPAQPAQPTQQGAQHRIQQGMQKSTQQGAPQVAQQGVQQGAQQGTYHEAHHGYYYPQPQLPSMMQDMLSPPFPPPLYPQGGGQGHQPMFPMMHYPPPTPVYVGVPVMTHAHPIPPPQHFPQQPPSSAVQAPVTQASIQQGHNQNPAPIAPAPTSAPQPPGQSVPSTPAHSRNLAVPGPSAAGNEPKTEEISEFDTLNTRIRDFRNEFETARSFEDHYIYFPNDKPGRK